MAWLRRILGVGAIALLALYGSVAPPYDTHVGILTCFAVVLAVSYRLLLIAGEASFCHGAFYALGAYAVGILTVKLDWAFWLALPVAVVVGIVAALVIGIPSLRTRGSYFFLMTFGFAVVTEALLESASPLTGGFTGLTGIGQPAGISSIRGFFYLALAVAVLSLLAFHFVDRTAWGLRLRALGDSVDLAEATGVNRFAVMLAAFTLGGMFAGLAGGIYASYMQAISPNSFTIWVSIYVLAYAVIGGARSIWGPVLGAVLLSYFPVVFSWSQTLVAILTAAAMLVVIMAAPRGLLDALRNLALAVVPQQGRIRMSQLGLIRAPRQAVSDTPGQSSGHEPRRASLAVPAAVPRPRKTGPVLLRVNDVSVRFGGVAALSQVSLEVREGETVGVIGPNGAGKTTLFNVISGTVRPDTGEVDLGGERLSRMRTHRVARAGVVRTFQSAVVFDRLTVAENIRMAAMNQEARTRAEGIAVPIAEQVRRVLDDFGLSDRSGDPAGTLPYGLRKVLGVAIGVAARPRVLCLDEPVAGLTGAEIDRMVEALEALQRRNQTMLLVEHRMPLVTSVCDRLYVLDFGEVIASGAPEDVLADQAVRDAYLGGGEQGTHEHV